MRTNQVPIHVLGPLRVISKAGFLTKRIWNDFFATGQRSWRCRRWHRLMSTGYFNSVPDYGFVESAVTLSDKGKALADMLGMNPVYSPSAKNLWHDEELIRLALYLERQGWISSWKTEQELKIGGQAARYFPNQARDIKIPDLIVEWETSPNKILWAIELERTRKEFSRYYEMVGAYKGISQIESVLVIVAANSIEANIKKAQGRMNYHQAQRPMFFASMNQIIEDPLSCELRQGSNRMTFGKFARTFTGKSALEPTLLTNGAGSTTGNKPRNKVGNNVSSTSEVA